MPYFTPSPGVFPEGDYPNACPKPGGAHAPAVFGPVFEALWSTFLAPGQRTLVVEDGVGFLRDAEGVELAKVDLTGDRGRLIQGIGLLGRATCQRFVRWLVVWCYWHFRCGGRLGALPLIERGVDGLVGLMNLKGSATATEVRALLEAAHRVAPVWAFEAGEPLIRELSLTKGGYGVRARLRIQCTRFISPGLSPRDFRRQERYLYPVTLCPPNTRGRKNDVAVVWRLDIEMVRRVRLAAMTVAECGSLTLDRDDLDDIAARAGTTTSFALAVFKRWLARPAATPTVVVLDVRPQRVAVTLGNTVEAALIREGGRESLHGRAIRRAANKYARQEPARASLAENGAALPSSGTVPADPSAHSDAGKR